MSGSKATNWREAQEAARREDSTEGYRAVDGSWVEIPKLQPLSQSTPLTPRSPHIGLPEALQGASHAQALRVIAQHGRESLTERAFTRGRNDPFDEALRSYLAAPEADARHLERIDLEMEARIGPQLSCRPMRRGDLLRAALEFAASLPVSPWRGEERAFWPLVAEHFNVLDDRIEIAKIGPYFHPVDCLKAFPKAPMRYLEPMVQLGFFGPKDVRQGRRALLSGAPAAAEALCALLDHDDASRRIDAAEWLAARGDASAVKARFEVEDAAPARAALARVLDRLGAATPMIFDAESMIRDAAAAKVNRSKLMAAMTPSLPIVRFRNGEEVSPQALKWLLSQAIDGQMPGGDKIVEGYLTLFDPEDGARFSLWALQSWIDYDTAKPSDAEATKKALKGYYGAPPAEDSAEFQKRKARMFAKYVRNGFSTRGVLAAAALAPDSEAGLLIRHYLERHGTRHGSRAAQGAALIMLAARIGGPACLEAVAWASGQSKHVRIAEAAAEQLEAIRVQRGWSPDALADRIAPDLGFDAAGAQDIPLMGDAQPYRARLDDALSLQLFNPNGKQVKALPAGKSEPRKEARKRLTNLKKHLAATVSAQTDRLFAAMCTQRIWSVEDWRTFIFEHPIVRRMAQRLVWMAGADGAAAAVVFRPTPEGDLTDVADGAVALDELNGVRIAHGSLLHQATAEAWSAHFSDYEITPLFAQLGRRFLTLEEKPPPDAHRLEIRSGWRMDSSALMREASRLGYAPAGTGRSYIYEYSFPTLHRRVAGVEITIEAHGPPPQQGGTVTLTGAQFSQPIGAISPILLSEVWNDYLEMTSQAVAPETGGSSSIA